MRSTQQQQECWPFVSDSLLLALAAILVNADGVDLCVFSCAAAVVNLQVE